MIIRKCVSGGYKIVDFGGGTTTAISTKRAKQLLKSGRATLGKSYAKKGKKSASPW